MVYGTLSGGQDSPAKKALVEQLKSRYSTIERLNKAWGTTFASWRRCWSNLIAHPLRWRRR